MDNLKPELSKHNPYWISKHRYYELKHFCLQYPDWIKQYRLLSGDGISKKSDEFYDPTGTLATKLADIKYKIDLVKMVAFNTDSELYLYIIKSVTNNESYNKLRMIDNIPCGRDYFYERYRKFFYLLHLEKTI